jgi:alpha-1,2-mannosyltransferase
MLGAMIHGGWHQLRQRSLVVALVLFFSAIYTQYALKIKHSDHGMRSAFLRWKTQLEDLDHGVNVWEKYAYPNPPIMALVLRPFLQLAPTLGSSLWFCCKAALALASILGVLSLLDFPERPFPAWGKTLAVVMSLRPVEGDLVHGNVNLLILFLLVASLWAFCRRRDGLAGLLMGLSIACKLTPALFLLYFLWKGAWKTLCAAAVSMIAFVLFLPAVAFGWSSNLDYLRSWHHQMVAPYAAGIVTSEHKNQSLPGLLHRMLSEEASFSDYEGDRKVVLETHNLACWERDTVQAIIIACMALFALLAMGFCRASIEKRPPLQLLAEFSVIVLGMLLFCERTWKHHCVTLLLPFSVLAYCVSAPLFSRGFRWYLGITLTFVALLMLSTSTGIYDQHIDVQDRFGKLAQVYGAYVWAFLLLLASTFVISWANPESGSKLDGHQSEPEAHARAGLATNETLRSLALRAQNLPRE